MATALREEGFAGHISLGGHHAAFNAEEILADWPAVDSIVLGEGEEPLADLTRDVLAGRDWRGIPSLAFRVPGGVTRNPCRPLIDDLGGTRFAQTR